MNRRIVLFTILSLAILLIASGLIGVFADQTYVYVSDLDQAKFKSFNSPYDGYAPGFDKDSGGGALAIGGTTFNKGIFMHANNDFNTNTQLEIDINGLGFTGFYATIGVHASMPGSVVFFIYGDGNLLYKSEKMTNPKGALTMSVDVKNVKKLTLEIGNGGDGYNSDWAVFGDARFGKGTYVDMNPEPTPAPTDVPFVPGEPMYLSDLPKSKFNVPNLPFEGYELGFDVTQNGSPISLKGQQYAKGIWMHASPEYDASITEIDISDYDFTSFTAKVGIDDAMASVPAGSCEFIVYGDDRELAFTDVINGGDDYQEIKVNIKDVKLLTLMVTNGGDNHGFDWADWADALLGYEDIATPVPTDTPVPTPTATPKAGTDAPDETGNAEKTEKPGGSGNTDNVFVYILIGSVAVIAACAVVIILIKTGKIKLSRK